jgi:hypothetical protein
MAMTEGAAPTIDYEQIIANQRASAKKHIEEERRRQENRLAIGRFVTIRRLQVSKNLNGLFGIIIQEINEGGRIGVRLEGRGDKLVKERNIDAFPDEAVVKLARYGADGEKGVTGGVRTWFWPRMILEQSPYEVSPVSKLIGIDLCVAKVNPLYEKFNDRAQYDNQWATFLMIDPLMYGFAPDRWQAFVGPVVVWRASWQPFSSDDASLLHDYLTDLLDKYAQRRVRVSRDITPAAFRRSKKRSLQHEQMNSEDVQQSVDVNI